MKHYRALALKELLAQRLTSILVLLAIVLSTTMMAVIGQSMGVLAAMRQQQAIAIAGNRYAGFIQMDEAQVEALKNDPRLSFVGTYVALGSMRLSNTLLLGLSEFQEDVSAVYPSVSTVREGRLPTAPMEIALPEDVLGYLGFSGKPGDTLTLSLSKALRHGVMTQSYDFTADFTLVGITESNYLNYTAGIINGIVGPGTADALLPEAYFYYNVDVRMADKGTFQAVMDDLTAALNVHELDAIYNTVYLDALGIRYNTEASGDISGAGFSLMTAAGILVGTLLLLAAGLVIFNILKIAVSRRTTQYGVLRAMGADKGQLYSLVSAQVLLLCAAGIPAGLLLGTLSARGILTAATGLLSPEIFLARDAGELNRLIAENGGGKGLFLLASAAVTLIFALTAALPAARYAAAVAPTAAMSGTQVKVKRRRGRKEKKIRNFEAFYARLNLKRSRGRTAITVLSLVMSITVFITLQGAVDLLNAAGSGAAEHYGDYSITNEVVGFSTGEYQAMLDDPRVAELTAMQFVCYDQGADGYPVGIELGFPLQAAETFQVVGLNGAYWDKAFSALAPELLERLKAGEGCMVRNPLPLVFEGQEIPRTSIRTGGTITVAGRELEVLATLDGYDTTYLSVGNSGFINGVQVIVNEEQYAALTGKTEYNELLPALTEGVDRAEFDEAAAALAGRVPGTVWLSYEDTDRQLAESFQQIQFLAWGLILFVALIGLLNIVNTVYTNIHTRVAEIGVQRAIGMSAGSLFKVFLWEGAYYGMIAAVIGSAAGYICTIFVEAAAANEIRLAAVPVIPIVEAAALAIAACLLATCIPLRRISKMNIVDSIETVE